MSPRWTGSPRSARLSASSSWVISARTGGTARNRCRRRRRRSSGSVPTLRVARDVAEGDDEPDVGALERAAEREVAHPAAVGGDPVADGQREHERADRRRGEHGLRQRLGRRLVGRVGELVRAVGVLGDVGREHDQLDRRSGERVARARSARPAAQRSSPAARSGGGRSAAAARGAAARRRRAAAGRA